MVRRFTLRYLILPALFGAEMYGADEITIPIQDGSVVIRPQFIRGFEIGGLCNGEPRQWTVPATTSLGLAEDHPVVREYLDTVIPLVGRVDGCTTEIIKTSLVLRSTPPDCAQTAP